MSVPDLADMDEKDSQWKHVHAELGACGLQYVCLDALGQMLGRNRQPLEDRGAAIWHGPWKDCCN